VNRKYPLPTILVCVKDFTITTLAAVALSGGAIVLTPLLSTSAMAQTNISGDIAGTVTDNTGAAIPGAAVTVTSEATGATKKTTSGGRGEYRAPLLEPGVYDVAVSATGFEGSKTTVTVAAGQVSSGDVKLDVGKESTVVEVSAAEPLIHTEDAQISTSFTMQQVQSLPNPGNDLTFIAQTSPGAVMNTEAGYGNFSVFGLPAASNTFTVNGGYQNDPFLNLNNSGATNLLLGNNDVADVTVTSNAYDAAFGGLGGAQVNEISRSGGNGFHGNATYWWNGSSLNANDYFNKAFGSPRPFDNVNQWAAAVGGPIKKDKLFFFGDYEGLRIVLPTRDTVYAPNAAQQTLILSQIPTSQVPLYTNIFNAYNHAPGFGTAIPDPANPTQLVQFNGVADNFTHEWLATGRMDWNIGQNDKLFIHSKVDKGVQATFTSLLDPVYDALSPQPQYGGELQETHTFTPNLTNQFLFTAEYYRAIFTNQNLAEANALIPFSLIFQDTDLASNSAGGIPGGEDADWIEGRNVTNYQFADDLSWTRGNHTIKLGWSMRRDDVSDYDPGILATAAIVLTHYASFSQGLADVWLQNFPVAPSQPLAVYNMGGYIQDTWKAMPNLTVTYGLRLEHNSNPTCITNCFGYTNGDFYGLPTATTTPFNQLLKTGQNQAFTSLQKVGYEPRIGFSWQPRGVGTGTVIRGGFGIFVDTFPATIADGLLNNAPLSVATELLGAYYGGPSYLMDPKTVGSAGQAAASFAANIHSCFSAGCSSSSVGFAPNVLTTSQHVSYPTYEEYSLAVEHQINRNTALSVSYVGNHGYHEPVQQGSANAYGFGVNYLGGIGASGPGTQFTGLPLAPPNPNFGSATVDYAGATSNYNGLITTLTHRERYVTLQLNYSYSHALDEISNGGFLPFGNQSTAPISPYNLSQNYGNADYDTRHYISGSYVITVPHWGGPRVLTDGWEVSGTVFHNTGYPFSVADGLTTGDTAQYAGGVLAKQTGVGFANHCGGAAYTVVSGVGCSFASTGGQNTMLQNYAFATNFGQQERNQIFGSGFTDTDLDVMKAFHIPGWEAANLKLGTQFFNLFNHSNFGLPYNSTSSLAVDPVTGAPTGAGSLGQSHNLQATPTSILGSFLGGDAAPRLIQFKAVFTF
jgi:hypothetical protein